jgi:hypothetical protein
VGGHGLHPTTQAKLPNGQLTTQDEFLEGQPTTLANFLMRHLMFQAVNIHMNQLVLLLEVGGRGRRGGGCV